MEQNNIMINNELISISVQDLNFGLNSSKKISKKF